MIPVLEDFRHPVYICVGSREAQRGGKFIDRDYISFVGSMRNTTADVKSVRLPSLRPCSADYHTKGKNMKPPKPRIETVRVWKQKVEMDINVHNRPHFSRNNFIHFGGTVLTSNQQNSSPRRH